MRIVFFVHRYGSSIGGVETYARQLARALVDLGHNVHVVAGATADDQPEIESFDGIVIHRFPATRSPMRCRLWFMKNLPLFRSAGIIQISNTHMLELFRRMLGPLVDRKKVFLTRHGMSGKFPVPESEIARARRAQQYVAGVAHDGVFIERWLGVTPDICPDQGLFPTADEIEQKPEPPPLSAVFIGRLEPDTGIRLYIDGVKQRNQTMSKRSENTDMPGLETLETPLPLGGRGQGEGVFTEICQPFELHIYGDGSLRTELQAQVRRENLPVHFHGPHPDARERLSDHCFAFVDGRMAIQEAFARRRVVIAGYQNEWKRDYLCGERFSPFLIPVNSPNQLVEHVQDLITNPDRRHQIVDRAFEYARTLNWSRTAEAFGNLWQSKTARFASRKKRSQPRSSEHPAAPSVTGL